MHEKPTASLISDIVFLQLVISFETLLVFASKLKHAQLEELVFIHHFSSYYYGILHFTFTVFRFSAFPLSACCLRSSHLELANVTHE